MSSYSMPPDLKFEDIINGILAFSKSLTLDNKPAYTDIICYHCQQAVEKYLKAYLVHLRQAQGDTRGHGEPVEPSG
jgi:HEPN domain-containing protein